MYIQGTEKNFSYLVYLLFKTMLRDKDHYHHFQGKERSLAKAHKM